MAKKKEPTLNNDGWWHRIVGNYHVPPPYAQASGSPVDIVDREGNLVARCRSEETAKFIIALCNGTSNQS